jgi:tRNA threonylcarbamoyl adenosine modification protein YjeE
MAGQIVKLNCVLMVMKTDILFNIQIEKEEDCKHIAQEFLNALTHLSSNPSFSAFNYIALMGDLGAGKTTFVRYVLQQLAFHGRVKSPSYTLLETYPILMPESMHFLPYTHVCHFDLYRINNADMWLDYGFGEYMQHNNFVFIEWAQHAQIYLPKPYLKLDIQILDEQKRCFCLSYEVL